MCGVMHNQSIIHTLSRFVLCHMLALPVWQRNRCLGPESTSSRLALPPTPSALGRPWSLFTHPCSHSPLPRAHISTHCPHLQAWHVTFQSQEEQLDRWAAANALKGQARYSPEPALFHALFPQHILLDRNLRIVQLGAALLNPRPCTPTPSPSPCATPSRSPLSPSSSSSSSRLPPSGGPAIGAPAHVHFEIVSPPHISGGVFTHLDSVASVGAWDLQRLAGEGKAPAEAAMKLQGSLIKTLQRL